MQADDKSKKSQSLQWRSIEELLQTRSADSIKLIQQAALSSMEQETRVENESSSSEKSVSGVKAKKNFATPMATKVLLWAFFVSLLLAITASTAVFFARRFWEHVGGSADNRMMAVMLKAERIATLGDYEQAKWILKTLRELEPLDGKLQENVLLSERLMSLGLLLKEVDFALIKGDVDRAQLLIAEIQKEKLPSDEYLALMRLLRDRQNLMQDRADVQIKPVAVKSKAMHMQKPLKVPQQKTEVFASELNMSAQWQALIDLFQAEKEEEACEKLQAFMRDSREESAWLIKAKNLHERRCG